MYTTTRGRASVDLLFVVYRKQTEIEISRRVVSKQRNVCFCTVFIEDGDATEDGSHAAPLHRGPDEQDQEACRYPHFSTFACSSWFLDSSVFLLLFFTSRLGAIRLQIQSITGSRFTHTPSLSSSTHLHSKHQKIEQGKRRRSATLGGGQRSSVIIMAIVHRNRWELEKKSSGRVFLFKWSRARGTVTMRRGPHWKLVRQASLD